MINNIIAGNNTISADDLKNLKEVFHTFCFDILGLKEEIGSSDGREASLWKSGRYAAGTTREGKSQQRLGNQ